jgi:hypothetical protein
MPQRRDPAFNKIKKQIVSMRNKLRKRFDVSKVPTARRKLHAKFKKLAKAHYALNLGALENFEPTSRAAAPKRRRAGKKR